MCDVSVLFHSSQSHSKFLGNLRKLDGERFHLIVARNICSFNTHTLRIYKINRKINEKPIESAFVKKIKHFTQRVVLCDKTHTVLSVTPKDSCEVGSRLLCCSESRVCSFLSCLMSLIAPLIRFVFWI